MAWTYEQKFNTLANGNLNGQDGWSVPSGIVTVQTNIVYEGAKAIELDRPNGSANAIRSIEAINEGTVYFAIRTAGSMTWGAHDAVAFHLQEGTTTRMRIQLGQSNIWILDNTTDVSIYSSAASNTWYLIALQFDNINHPNQYRARVHDGAWQPWSDWKTVGGGSYTEINRIFIPQRAGEFNSFIDTITPTNPYPPPAVPKSRGFVF